VNEARSAAVHVAASRNDEKMHAGSYCVWTNCARDFGRFQFSASHLLNNLVKTSVRNSDETREINILFHHTSVTVHSLTLYCCIIARHNHYTNFAPIMIINYNYRFEVLLYCSVDRVRK